MISSEKQFVFRMCSKERETLMYEVFLDKGFDVFGKKNNFAREHRPLVKYEF